MQNSSELPENEILQELEALESLLPKADQPNGLATLVRILRTEPGSNWPDLLLAHRLDQWLFLPLGQDKFPALELVRERLNTLSFQKDHDPLTGLRNRRAFEQCMGLEIERASRFKTPISLCIMDIDNFKSINDTHGHPIGDRVLEQLASILQNETRKIDVTARIGGEEFALILPGTGLTRAQKLLLRVLEAIRETEVVTTAANIRFTCSMGVASYRGKQAPDAEKLYQAADKALYRAKHSGKNRIECAPILDLGAATDQTLVLQSEKQFLFS